MNFPAYLKHLRQQGKRVFTVNQVMLDLNLSYNAALAAISRTKEQGNVISPAKGFYIIIPPEYQLYGSIPAEELVPLLMDHLHVDYYVSLLSAALYYGAAHQKAANFQLISNKRFKHPLEFGQVRIECIYKKSIENLPIVQRVVSTGYLNVASSELTSLDLFLYSEKSGGLNHIATVLSELIEAIDPNKLIVVAESVKQKTWLQRLGYMLEKIDSMDNTKSTVIIDTISAYLKDKNIAFIPLAAELPITGAARSKKWKIIENTSIESDI